MENVGAFHGHFVIFIDILVIFSQFALLYQEKSGSPAK
jgi:hypothetical protein